MYNFNFDFSLILLMFVLFVDLLHQEWVNMFCQYFCFIEFTKRKWKLLRIDAPSLHYGRSAQFSPAK